MKKEGLCLYFLLGTYCIVGIMSHTNGIVDLSHWNLNVDFQTAKRNGLKAVIHKATQGISYVDANYQERKESAKKNGILWGAYHFATNSNGTEQANHFLKTIGDIENTLIALDLEENEAATVTPEVAVDFVRRIKQVTNRLPFIYGSLYFLNTFSNAELTACPLWFAKYGPEPVVLPKGWPRWTLWQHTDGRQGVEPGPFPGLGYCDKDKFNGDPKMLEQTWPFL